MSKSKIFDKWFLMGLLLVIVLIFINLFNNKQNLPDDYIDYYQENIKVSDYDSLEIFTLNNRLDNFLVSSVNHDEIDLLSIIKQKTLIYRFTEFSCSYCVENDIQILKHIDSLTHNSCSIALMSQLPNTKHLKILTLNNDWKLPAYNYSKSLNIPIEIDSIKHNPYYILIDEDLKVLFVKASDPSYTVSHPFFLRIIEYLKSNG